MTNFTRGIPQYEELTKPDGLVIAPDLSSVTINLRSEVSGDIIPLTVPTTIGDIKRGM